MTAVLCHELMGQTKGALEVGTTTTARKIFANHLRSLTILLFRLGQSSWFGAAAAFVGRHTPGRQAGNTPSSPSQQTGRCVSLRWSNPSKRHTLCKSASQPDRETVHPSIPLRLESRCVKYNWLQLLKLMCIMGPSLLRAAAAAVATERQFLCVVTLRKLLSIDLGIISTTYSHLLHRLFCLLDHFCAGYGTVYLKWLSLLLVGGGISLEGWSDPYTEAERRCLKWS